ncbi:nucleolar protein 12-domain-containing protein [Diplogelasinospora grovesii]|uniref:Nucleolar protein 12-domain-containing protein n=1 Tax=Diplogelasinospora grovesii TaxID=303347 RepID=A0AAN6NHT4_9PEZI|nr:nucleolar protein 12-domain-containing protein [Diplogelasinospora grovesii]
MFAQPRIKKTAPPPPKKRKTVHAIEEITFDKDARADYLTGFRKRKLARIKHAQEIAAEKEREERIAMRKQIREERKQQVEEHVQTITKILREAREAGGEAEEEEGDGEWDGISDDEVAPEPEPIDREEEYIDEDRYTTVTVEAVHVDRDGLHKPTEHDPEEKEQEDGKTEAEGTKDGKEAGSDKRKHDHPKKKKKKFRYETKFERKLTERKQKAKKAKR